MIAPPGSVQKRLFHSGRTHSKISSAMTFNNLEVSSELLVVFDVGLIDWELFPVLERISWRFPPVNLHGIL